MKATIIILFTFIWGYTSANAQDIINSTYHFLRLPVSARSAGLGGDVVSLPDGDVSLFPINPSYLQKSSQDKLSLSYINQISDINMAFLNGACYLPAIGTIGAGIRYMNYGKFTQTDDQGRETGTFKAYDMAFSIGFGKKYMENWYYGAAIEFIHSAYDQYRSSAISFSLGCRYRVPNNHLTLGMGITEIGKQITYYDGVRENLPLNINFGVSQRLSHIPLRLSLTLYSLNEWNLRTESDPHNPGLATDFLRHIKLGCEFLFSEHVFLRLGYNHYLHEELKTSNRIDLAGTSIGAGISFKKIQFDISRNSYSQLGGFTQISLSTTL